MIPEFLKCDLHVHSKHSKHPSEWILKKLGCSESYTEPLVLYDIARRRGMDLVTITDHNTLAGSLDIAHLPGTFVSEEITTYFPEDHCKLHVLAWDITEAQHEDISRARENVLDLTAYLRDRGIAHALAHPLYDMDHKLTPEHFERLLLLFNTFELNGARDRAQNSTVRTILGLLTKEEIELLADRHGIRPWGEKPWEKGLVSGSDDHSSLNIARSHTRIRNVGDADGFLSCVMQGRGEPFQVQATPRTMAYNLYSIAYQFYRERLGLEPFIKRDMLLRFVDNALTLRMPEQHGGLTGKLRDIVLNLRAAATRRQDKVDMKSLLYREALEIVRSGDGPYASFEGREDKPWDTEQDWFDFVDRSSERVLVRFADSILDSVSGADIFDVFSAVGSAVSSYTLLAPFVVGYTLFTKDREFCRTVRNRFARMRGQKVERQRVSMAHFTDTFFEINGVARTLNMQVDAARKNGKDLTILTCHPDGKDRPGVKNFEPIGTFDIPEYPGLAMHYPPLLKMLDYCFEKGVTHIHAATPGPVGLAALAVARIMGLPFVCTYHTAFPQYAQKLTGDPAMEEVVWKYMIWFSEQADSVFVPSRAMRDELAERGVNRRRLVTYPRGIDTKRFHPARRLGRPDTGELTLLYVGRISREKSLPDLARAFQTICRRRKDVKLIVVGDGPYLQQMQAELAGLPATFTGFLAGDALTEAYTWGDVFVFPSTTDTFGNVVLEAQSAGMPVIVTDQGGPQENMLPGETGIIVPTEEAMDPAEGFVQAVIALADDPERVVRMGQAARKAMKNRSFERCYLELWDLYRTAGAPARAPQRTFEEV